MQQNPNSQLLHTLSPLKQSIKTTLRAAIIQKLQSATPPSQPKRSIQSRLICSLICEYMSATSCQYSTSIYCLQSGYEDGLLSRGEMLQLLSLSPPPNSLLQSLLERYHNTHQCCSLSHNSTQTMEQCSALEMQDKLLAIDRAYRQMPLPVAQPWVSVAVVERGDYERFREFQVQRVRLEVGEEWRRRFEEYSKEMEGEYRRKYQVLRRKERAMEEEYVGRRKIMEDNRNSMEDTIKERMELVQMKGRVVEEQVENLREEREKYQRGRRQERGSRKSRESREKYQNVEKKVQKEVNICKLAMEQQYYEKQREFMERKKFVDEEYGKVVVMMKTAELIGKDNERLTRENQRMRVEIEGVRREVEKYIGMNQEKNGRINKYQEQIQGMKREREQLLGEQRRKKKMESEVVNLRKQLERYRSEEQMTIQYKKQNKEEPCRDLNHKLQVLKQNRRKDIEMFKIGL